MAIEKLQEALAQIIKDYPDDPRIGFVQGISAVTNAAYLGTEITPYDAGSARIEDPLTPQPLEITPTDPLAPTMERLQALFRQLRDDARIADLFVVSDEPHPSFGREWIEISRAAPIPDKMIMSAVIRGLRRNNLLNIVSIETVGDLRRTPAPMLDRIRGFGPTRVAYLEKMLGRNLNPTS
jgi:hypothetical protein